MRGVAMAIMFAGIVIHTGLRGDKSADRMSDASKTIEAGISIGVFLGALYCIVNGY